MAARNTTEQGLRSSVAFVTAITNGARPRGVCWIDQSDWHTRELGLVGDEQTQLAERPITVSCALFGATNPDPRANATQIFECNRSLRVFGLRNNVLANPVILVFLKPGLATRQLTQTTFSRLRTNGLKDGATTSIALTNTLNRRASVCLAHAHS